MTGIRSARLQRCGPRAAALAAAMLALTAFAPAALNAQDIGLPIGSTPEPVEVEDLDGNPVDLAQFIGKKPVVIEFWATWCPVCKALEPEIHKVHERWGDDVELIIMAIAVNQSQRAVKRHLERHPLPGRVLWDTRGRATRAFQAPTTSYIVVLDAQGRVVYTGAGEEQDVVAAVERVVDASQGQGEGEGRGKGGG
jgi:thiol-disulfide isomerase/thioredoxin